MSYLSIFKFHFKIKHNITMIQREQANKQERWTESKENATSANGNDTNYDNFNNTDTKQPSNNNNDTIAQSEEHETPSCSSTSIPESTTQHLTDPTTSPQPTPSLPQESHPQTLRKVPRHPPSPRGTPAGYHRVDLAAAIECYKQSNGKIVSAWMWR